MKNPKKREKKKKSPEILEGITKKFKSERQDSSNIELSNLYLEKSATFTIKEERKENSGDFDSSQNDEKTQKAIIQMDDDTLSEIPFLEKRSEKLSFNFDSKIFNKKSLDYKEKIRNDKSVKYERNNERRVEKNQDNEYLSEIPISGKDISQKNDQTNSESSWLIVQPKKRKNKGKKSGKQNQIFAKKSKEKKNFSKKN